MSIAVDPRTDELLVYNTTTDLTHIQVSVFAVKADGNVPSVRTISGISGPATRITGPGLPPGNKIAISADGRLFVAEANLRILAFAPGGKGNVAPSKVIKDSPGPVTTEGSPSRGRGGQRDEEGCSRRSDEAGRE
jgi:hypothetical protein